MSQKKRTVKEIKEELKRLEDERIEEQKKEIRKFQREAWLIATERMREIGNEQIDRGLIPEGNIFFMGAIIFQGMNEELLKTISESQCGHSECEEHHTTQKEKLLTGRGLH